jgi:methylmalonyl-CoA/ethylmalonyl-CoA epimerase
LLRKIHHIGVAVRSADSALGFYRDALGLPVTKDAVLEEQGVRGVLVAAGDTEIELLEPLSPDSAVGRFIARRGEGLHHCCFETDDIASELAVARQRGLPLIDEQPRPGLAGMIAFVHPRATRGVLVEYAQPPDGTPADTRAEMASPEFDHVAVAVADLDGAVETYTHNFALSESDRGDRPALGIRASALPIGAAWIGLVTPLSADTAVGRFLQQRGEGLYLISLRVPDLGKALSELATRGIGFTDSSSAGGGSIMAFIRPRYSAGALIQLVEQRPAAAGAE